MFIFLCAEITAVAMLIKYISNTPLWITAALIMTTTLIYTLYGGLKASILTDNFQFIIIIILLLICFYNIFNYDFVSYKYISINSGFLLSAKYIPNYTSGITFFIAVAATNLFHQGNWQRIFAAKNKGKDIQPPVEIKISIFFLLKKKNDLIVKKNKKNKFIGNKNKLDPSLGVLKIFALYFSKFKILAPRKSVVKTISKSFFRRD